VDDVLFELGGDPPALPKLKEPRLGALNAKWTQHKAVTHKPCDMDIQRIHDHGVAGAPPPRPARWKRVGPNDTLYLCDIDAEEMKRKDAEATAAHDARVARAAEMRRAHAGERSKR
jgi:hypothetical protein